MAKKAQSLKKVDISVRDQKMLRSKKDIQDSTRSRFV